MYKLLITRKGSWKLHIEISGEAHIAYFKNKLPLLFNVDDPWEKYNVANENQKIVKDLLAELDMHKIAVEKESNYFSKN